MKTFATRSWTNYGEVIHLINANTEEEARSIADDCDTVWDYYQIEEVSTTIHGIVFIGGGDGG